MAKFTFELFDLEKSIAGKYISSFNYPWEILSQTSYIIEQIASQLDMSKFNERSKGIWIANNATISPSAEIIAPCIIDENATLRHSAFIRGNAIIGKNTTIGNCVEIKNSIIFDFAEVPHFNYVGDSILGYKAHLGGGTITSNVKIDKSNVKVSLSSTIIDSGMMKLGAMIADCAEVGSNCVLNPGCIISRRSRVYPLCSVRGFIPPDSILKDKNTLSQLK